MFSGFDIALKMLPNIRLRVSQLGQRSTDAFLNRLASVFGIWLVRHVADVYLFPRVAQQFVNVGIAYPVRVCHSTYLPLIPIQRHKHGACNLVFQSFADSFSITRLDYSASVKARQYVGEAISHLPRTTRTLLQHTSGTLRLLRMLRTLGSLSTVQVSAMPQLLIFFMKKNSCKITNLWSNSFD